ncbi:hypothetical protein NLJ89_g5327 [Agrocybe chaxingu]|uniref:Uncharacterized protein n=1 Tax=Agrocybe chaxingu TaxID=84603 RepID=A0A9W8K1G3_9AGAR|nr:hypothetical protein NLJ89_g5327 [Agrocybe chaxingu]
MMALRLPPDGNNKMVRLLNVLVRDGTLYFFVIFLVNLVNAFLFFLAPNNLKSVATTLSVMLTSVMISRLVLNLRSAPSAGINLITTREIPRPKSSLNFNNIATIAIGNLGEEVGALNSREEELESVSTARSESSRNHLRR